MREPQRLHTTTQHTGPNLAKNVDHTSTPCDSINLTIEVALSQPPTTTINLGKTITPADASDVTMQQKIDPTPNYPSFQTRMNLKPPFRKKRDAWKPPGITTN
jgi:hypothetical protein